MTSALRTPSLQPNIDSPREHLVRASDRLWRVVENGTERIIGHLRVMSADEGLRYRAERLHRPTSTFRPVGDFWRADDAVQSLRNG
ncbi:hypothetical protein [uncultured Microbacterium sp.]|uniref:hypothetical protein n=1 Tax=uncultured Microbacterium sp. TaxID=191216 RepID=UPI00260EF81A|nr:hypothetical protein [uncultured Microbacterium sp.]